MIETEQRTNIWRPTGEEGTHRLCVSWLRWQEVREDWYRCFHYLNEKVKLCPAAAKFRRRFHGCNTTDTHPPWVVTPLSLLGLFNGRRLAIAPLQWGLAKRNTNRDPLFFRLWSGDGGETGSGLTELNGQVQCWQSVTKVKLLLQQRANGQEERTYKSVVFMFKNVTVVLCPVILNIWLNEQNLVFGLPNLLIVMFLVTESLFLEGSSKISFTALS